MTEEDKLALPVIGWREWVKLPDLGISRVKAKVDSGARSSSLHASNIEEFTRDGESWVRFQVHSVQRKVEKSVPTEAKVHDRRSVRSSSGKATQRYVILTTVVILEQPFEIELTLADREEMSFRMLLGREAFRRRFLLDAGGSYFGGRPKRRTTKT